MLMIAARRRLCGSLGSGSCKEGLEVWGCRVQGFRGLGLRGKGLGVRVRGLGVRI